MIQDIYIIDDDDKLKNVTSNIFKDNNEYRFKKVITKQIDIALKNIPSIIIVNEDAIDVDVIDLCEKIRNDEDNIKVKSLPKSPNK